MSENELRELDAWIHKHVMEGDLYVGLKKRGLCEFEPELYSSSPAAMEVLKKCAEDGFAISCQKNSKGWKVSRIYWESFVMHETELVFADTFELTICLFAKKVFSKS
jgi:hypothetical protein